MDIRLLASSVFITCILGLGEYVNIVGAATTVSRGGLRSVTLAILPSDGSLLSERSLAMKWTSSHPNAESIETSRYSTTNELPSYSTNTAELPKYSSNTAELPKYSTNTISVVKGNNTDTSNSSSFSTLSLSSLNNLSSTSLKRPLSILSTIKSLSTPFIEPTPLSVFSSFPVTTYYFSSSKYFNTDFSFSTDFLMHNSSSFNISSGLFKSIQSPSSNVSSSSPHSATLFYTSSPFIPSSLSVKLSAKTFASNSSLFDIHLNSTSFLRPRPSMSTTIISYSSFTYISQANISPLSASTISPSPQFSNHSIGTKIKNTMISYPLSSTESFHSTSDTRNRSVASSTSFTTYHISLIRLNKSQSFNMSSLTTKIRSSSVEDKSTAFSPKFMSTISTPKSVDIQKVIPNFLEFNGKLIVSMNEPLKSVDDLKQVSENVETILDEAFRVLQGYVYSKVLQITRKGQSRLQCPFKVFIKEPSNETSSSLKEKLKMYNKTQGFGEFILYSVDMVTHEESSQKETSKLWPIIVITVLCALCIVLAIALVWLQRRFKKMKTMREINDGNKPYPVYDGMDEHPNIPLKLMKSRVSTAESRKPLKSDSENEGSNVGDDEEIGNNPERRSSEENSDSSDDNTSNKEEDLDALQINEVKEEDETKFSTFSRKK